ncbi:DUF294 nucleotidyltransferase-like domain-containing protein [Thalassobacillus sp. CUG 92003]|uniref:DUF294 nucleotidyltransferase-like domain-containing protein n=1 Tax=Thalassobacillus sp. CUG 92003 TaxID=2736641 RepID=UPI0015E6E44A|nr:DUF294 nucleotidyltransferase-like domain-containing protein [Thalassobacillus sp. CUG 92003]
MTPKTHETPPNDYDIRGNVRSHTLFSELNEQVFNQLYKDCEERMYREGVMIAHAKKRREGIFIITEGMAEVCAASEGETSEVLEVVQPGELLGLGSLSNFLDNRAEDDYAYMVEIKAVERVVGLFVPYHVLSQLWSEAYIREYFLHQTVMRLKDVYVSLAEQVKLAHEWGESEPFIKRVQDMMTQPALTIANTQTIKQAAQKMIEHQSSSILIMEDEKLIGIVTEKDLVSRVVMKNHPTEQPVAEIMTRDPHTINRVDYYYKAMSESLLHGIKHLPVTNDREQVVGIITLSDLVRNKNQPMFSAIEKIDRLQIDDLSSIKTEIYNVLAVLLNDQVPALHILDVLTELYDRLSVRAVELAVASLKEAGEGDPPVSFAWYQMGSAGRGEQFLLTDQDHFLVYDHVSQAQSERAQDYFAKLGKRIMENLEQAGFTRCPGFMMASEEKWRGSLSTWQERLRRWAVRSTPDTLLLAENFFSFRKLYGAEPLHEAFKSMVINEMNRSRIFMYRLAQNENETLIPRLDQPIRSLLNLERKQIDLKKEVLFPFHHALQLLSLTHQIVEGTTVEKIDHLNDKNILSDWTAEDLKHALSGVMAIYIRHKWERLNQGDLSSESVVMFTHLSGREKDTLIRALKEMREMQSRMLREFSL